LSIAIAIAAFVATNIDDLFLLAAWFIRRTPVASILIGQLAGFTVIVLISVGAFLLGAHVPPGVIRWLGFIPIFVGVKELFWAGHPEDAMQSSSWLSVASVTIANGADNIGVYNPRFLRTEGGCHG